MVKIYYIYLFYDFSRGKKKSSNFSLSFHTRSLLHFIPSFSYLLALVRFIHVKTTCLEPKMPSVHEKILNENCTYAEEGYEVMKPSCLYKAN